MESKSDSELNNMIVMLEYLRCKNDPAFYEIMRKIKDALGKQDVSLKAEECHGNSVEDMLLCDKCQKDKSNCNRLCKIFYVKDGNGPIRSKLCRVHLKELIKQNQCDSNGKYTNKIEPLETFDYNDVSEFLGNKIYDIPK